MQLTIDFTVDQATRLAHAVGVGLALQDGNGVQRSATAPEVKQFVVQMLRAIVQRVERQEAMAAVPAPNTFDPT